MSIDESANPASTPGVRLGGGKFASKEHIRKLHLGLPFVLCECAPSRLRFTKAPILGAAGPSCPRLPKDDNNILEN